MPGSTWKKTAGHTEGHQCVVIRGAEGSSDLLIGDAAYTPHVYADPGLRTSEKLLAGPASDVPA